LARRILRAVFEVRTQISSVRNPVMWPGEVEAAKTGEGAPDSEGSEKFQSQSATVYSYRWSRLVSARTQLSVELLEAEVLWGKVIREPEKLLARCIGDLWIAVHRHLSEGTRFQVKETSEQWDARQQILYEDDPETNEFTRRVDGAVAEFERLLRPHIGAKHPASKRRD